MYIAKKEENGFTIHIMTDRGDTYPWSAEIYATEAKVMEKLDAMNDRGGAVEMWQQCYDIVSTYRSLSNYLGNACTALEAIKPKGRAV